jgi:Ulp1 protease family, C-terminal catalytic domain
MKTKKRYRAGLKTSALKTLRYRHQRFVAKHKSNNSSQSIKGNCNPESAVEGRYSCLLDPDLMLLKRMWNTKNANNPITSNDPKIIWSQLNSFLANTCKKETCWLKQDFIDKATKSKLIEQRFAPFQPKEWKKNPNEWLSSDDITNVMKQYENKYKCFQFLGPTPIDFDTELKPGECVWQEMCKFDLYSYMKKGKTKFGISINTDTHDGDGEHWVSLFINTKKGEIFYYDSAGYSIPAKVKRFVDRVISQGKMINISLKFHQNYPVGHQFKNTECGVYSLFFMIHMLEDKITSDYLKTHVIKDEYIQTFRNIFFNT